MALFRRFFYKKPPDGLLEISERVYVFDCCFTMEIMEKNEYKSYINGIASQLGPHLPDASYMVFNFGEGDEESPISCILSDYDMTVMEYPRHYEGCPLLPMEMIHHFLRSSESWLSLDKRNVILMHSERGGWPVLAFMLAALLIYTKQFTDERKTLDMIYKQAPREFLQLLSPLNFIPSQLRYLQYVSRRNVGSEWPPLDRALTLDCVILRVVPNMDGKGSCRPIFRIYGPDPFMYSDQTPKVLFSAAKRGKQVRLYNQADSDLIKLDINCHVQGDVVMECLSLDDDQEREHMMFRSMFNTAFIRSNILMLNQDEIETMWESKDQFPKDFRVEVLFSEMDSTSSLTSIDLPIFEDKNLLPMDAFSKIQEFFISTNCFDNKEGDLEQDIMCENSVIPDKISELFDDKEGIVHENIKPQIISQRLPPTSFSSSESSPNSSQGSPAHSSICQTPLSSETKGLTDTGIRSSVHEVIGTISTPLPPSTSCLSSSPLPPKLSVTSSELSPQHPTFSSLSPPLLTSISKHSPVSLSLASDTPSQEINFQASGKFTTSTPPEPRQPPPLPEHAAPSKVPTPPAPPLPPPSPRYADPSNEPPPPSSHTVPPPAPPLPPPSQRHVTSRNQAPKPVPPPPPPSLRHESSSKRPPPPAPPPPLHKHAFMETSQNNQLPPPALPPLQKHAFKETSQSTQPPPPAPPPPLRKLSLEETSVLNQPRLPVPPPAPMLRNMKEIGVSPSANNKAPSAPGPPPSSILLSKAQNLPRLGSKLQGQLRKSNLKPYHWLKLTKAVQGSIWAETQKPDETSKAPEIDMSELESLFSAFTPSSPSCSGKISRGSGTKPDRVQLIELRRAYNCEIMLSKVKVPLSDLMSSVLALDDLALDVDQVDNLIKFCPTKEEMDLLKAYNGDKKNLGRCEQFFLELLKVPRVESKLRVFSFKLQFQHQVSELRNSLSVVNSASDEIRSSLKLKTIMQTILSLGNALNQGTARGSAVGFKLDSLLKLTDTRAKNNKMTLMHYLCKVISEKLPDLLDFDKDLGSLEASTKIQLKYLAEEMQAVNKGLEKVLQELTASEDDGLVSHLFHKTLKEFLKSAESEVRSLALLYSNVGRNADALALYFGEDPARCPFEQVVSTLLNFVRMFIRSHEENCKQLEMEKKKAEKDAINKGLHRQSTPNK